MPALPASVEHDTRTWRRQADRILGFWDEHLKADASACIARADLVAAFNLWLTTNGHHAWSEELVNARFKGHSETAKHRVHEARPRGGATPDRPTWIALNPLPERPRIYLGVRFRTPAEIGENTEEIRQNAASGPTGPTQKETFSRSRGTKKFPKGLDHVDQSPDFDPDCEVTSDPMFDHGTQAVCAPSAPPVSMDEADEWEVFES
jgi:phage/plasmid-associated DNA primase